MKLSFLLNYLKTSELASVSKKNINDNSIVSYINSGLIEIYNRFQLATEEAIVTLRPDIPKTIYSLDGTDPDVIVNDQLMPADDMMSIIMCFNEDGSIAPINDEDSRYSIYTISYNKIQIPLLDQNTYVSLIYKRNPVMVQYIDDGSGHAAETSVDLPLQLLEALSAYIGYKAHGSITNAARSESNVYFANFLRTINDLKMAGVVTEESINRHTWNKKGFA